MKTNKIIAVCLCLAMLMGCSNDLLRNDSGNVNKSTVGGLLGAAGGAWIGSNIGGGKGNIVAIAAGTLLGAFAGYSLGGSLDRADAAYAQRSAHQAFDHNPNHVASSWKNPKTGHSGTITPTGKSYVGNTYCRDFTQTIYVDGKRQTAVGRACKNSGGTWDVVS